MVFYKSVYVTCGCRLVEEATSNQRFHKRIFMYYRYYPNTKHYEKKIQKQAAVFSTLQALKDLTPATKKQLAYLQLLGYSVENGISKRAASMKINELQNKTHTTAVSRSV